jgi:hypothetical protein
MAHHYVHNHTSTETLQEIDAILDEVKKEVNEKKNIDVKIFKEVYSIYSLFRNNQHISDNIVSIEDAEVKGSSNRMELFMTVYTLECKLKIANRKNRVSISPDFIWYAFATSKLLTINALSRLLAEIDDSRFARNMGLFSVDRPQSEWKEKLKSAVMLNPNIAEDMKLWLQLQ